MNKDSATPKELGSGTVESLIGSGGMAKVYKIWNSKLEINRAVKILRDVERQGIKDRFETESKISAKLHHPNIVEIHTIGEWNGLPFIEMELVEGKTIDDLIHEKGKLPMEVSCAIAIFIARALSYAHTLVVLLYGKRYKGIIHRDLKPQNIMISNMGVVKVMDFGIARPAETGIHTVETSGIIGTTQYLSPEQIDCKEIDCRADIYALGAVLYEMITGEKTFPQESMTDLISKKMSGDYRKFSELGIDAPRSLSKISQKCLMTDMQKRYGSAADLLEDLERAMKTLSGKPPEKIVRDFITGDSTVEEIKKFRSAQRKKKRAKRTGLAVVIVFAILVIGEMVVWLRMNHRDKVIYRDSAESAAQSVKDTVKKALPIDPAPKR